MLIFWSLHQPTPDPTRVLKRAAKMDSNNLRVARDKLTRVFRYLEALNQHRNPAKRQIREQLWSLWLSGLPDHPCIKRGAGKSNPSKAKAERTKSADADSD